MPIDAEAAYRAVQSRDARFDGSFFVAVRTTGIYCRPSCPARTAHRRNVSFFPSSAAAQRAGFRACKRCRPEATPGSADWNSRADLAGRAVRLIADGVIDREGVPGLARRLGYSERQVTRALVTEMGAPPLALARAQRAQTARVLLEGTTMTAADIAFGAGFSSIRQFNDTIQEVFATTPTGLRGRPNERSRNPGLIELRMAYRSPMSLATTLSFLGARAVAGLEKSRDGEYCRTLDLPHGAGLISLTDCTGCVRTKLRLTDQRDLGAAVARTRRLLDLDADPVAVDEVLARQEALEPLVRRRPGLRSPGAVDGFEMAVRAIVGQQVSVSGARTLLGGLVARYGKMALPGEDGWRLFPSPDALAGLDPAALPMPASRGRAIVALAHAVAAGELALDGGADREGTRQLLLALPGIGKWTADYVMMRAVGDPDIYLGSDLGIKRACGRISTLDLGGCAPWRSYLTHHLWAQLGGSSTRREQASSDSPTDSITQSAVHR